jgi:hypothetical protein
VYFLRQIIDLSQNAVTTSILRRLLPVFPPELQEQIRDKVRIKRN